jgi:hypothetical protein
MSKFVKGDKVVPNPEFAERMPSGVLGRVFTVEKVNPKNLRCSADDGGRGINFPAEILKAYNPDVPLGPQISRPFVERELFHEGEIVSLRNDFKQWTTSMPMVVIREGDKRIRIAPLGGAEGRYLLMPPSSLVKRDKMWVAERLLEEDAS